MSFLFSNFVDESANRTFLRLDIAKNKCMKAHKHYVTKAHIGTKCKMSSKGIM